MLGDRISLLLSCLSFDLLGADNSHIGYITINRSKKIKNDFETFFGRIEFVRTRRMHVVTSQQQMTDRLPCCARDKVKQLCNNRLWRYRRFNEDRFLYTYYKMCLMHKTRVNIVQLFSSPPFERGGN